MSFLNPHYETAISPKSASEVQGCEFDWLALDQDGHVAFFSTAGGGYAPASFLADTDAHDQAIAAILASPVVCAARFAPDLPPQLDNTWRSMAERGVYAFDAEPNGGPYRLVAAPQVAIHVTELPIAASDVARRLTLWSTRFSRGRGGLLELNDADFQARTRTDESR